MDILMILKSKLEDKFPVAKFCFDYFLSSSKLPKSSATSLYVREDALSTLVKAKLKNLKSQCFMCK